MCGVEPARASVVVACGDERSASVSGIISLPHQSSFGKANAPSRTVFPIGADQTAGTVAASKNRAWAIAALTVERWNGLVMRKVGSGRGRPRQRAGEGVVQITRTEKH